MSFLTVGALACAGALVSACSGGALMPSSGTGGGSGTRGGGGSGTAASPSCQYGPTITSCSSNAGTLPDPADQESPCTLEGARCEGTHCFDFGDMPFVTTCCAGRWRPFFEGPCPGPFHPGDPFACTADPTGPSCAIGQTYCSSANPDRTDAYVSSCQPICAAGDCTCFCDDPLHCDFRPADSTCPADICHCWAVTAGPSIAVQGAVRVDCTNFVPGSDTCALAPDLDARCMGHNRAVACAGGTDGLPLGCTLLSADSAASCGGETNYYCCDI